MNAEIEYYKQSILKSSLIYKILIPFGVAILVTILYILIQSIEALNNSIPNILLLLSTLVLFLRNSYIKYHLKSHNFDEMLKKYDWNSDYGTYFHKESNIPICLNCLYTLGEPIQMQKIIQDDYVYYMCNIKECNKLYRQES